MATHPADEPIRQAVTVPVPAEAAFAAVADLARWWPPEYTWATDPMASPQSWPLLLDRYTAMLAL